MPHSLVLIGPRDGLRSSDPQIPRLLDGLGDRVHDAGQLPLSSLQRFVAACDALVLPSLYEGFGLPPLEAMACGRAVAVGRTASLPEVCGPYAEYFDPFQVSDIAAALERLALRPPDREEDRANRRAWARTFDWDACADRTASALRACLDR